MKERKFDKVIDKQLDFQKNKYSQSKVTAAIFENPSPLMWHTIRLALEAIFEFLYSVLMYWGTGNYKHFQRMIDSMHIYYIVLYLERGKFDQIMLLSLPFEIIFMKVFSCERIKENMINLGVEIFTAKQHYIYPDYTCVWKIVTFLYQEEFGEQVGKIETNILPQTSDIYDKLLKIILSDNETAIDKEFTSVMSFRNNQLEDSSYKTNPYISGNKKWACFPIELLALMKYRYEHGKSIDFITDEVLSFYVPILKLRTYEVLPNILKCIDEVHQNSNKKDFNS